MRGFDQAALIARSLASKKGLTYVSALQRTTQADQIGKRRADRLKQMAGSFRMVAPAKVRGATVLLVDDVLTTGATLESAAAELRRCGAKHVDAVVVARHLLG
jgi:predicted amidophosphoribosyltransferase